DGLEVVALFMDGSVVARQTVIVVLAITRDGGKVPLGLRLGSTENAVVCTELLQDLLARGLTLDGRVLWVIDGGKGLRKALGDVFGDAAVIQRCQLHKARNLDALIPQPRQAYVRTSLRRAYRAPSAAAARRQLTALATWLERNGHADAAASMREGLEETLTVLKLGLPPTLRRFFATTNCIENLIGTLRHVTRNIKRWRDGDMRRRWIGLGLLRAAERFRRIKRHGELGVLVTAPGAYLSCSLEGDAKGRPEVLLRGNRSGILSLANVLLWLRAVASRRELLSLAELPFVEFKGNIALHIRVGAESATGGHGVVQKLDRGNEFEW